jgi:tetratricopeptide (TPR) repeat protein
MLWCVLPKKPSKAQDSNKSVPREQVLAILNEAMAAAEEITDPSVKASTLLHVGSTLTEIDKQQALNVLNRAVTVADNLSDPQSKSPMLDAIAYALAGVDKKRALSLFEQAISLAQSITNEPARVLTLCNIVRKMVKADVDHALSVVETMTDSKVKEEMLHDIAQDLVLEKLSLERALSVTQRITDTGWKASALSHILIGVQSADKQQAQNILNQVLAATENISEAERKDKLLATIAGLLSEFNIDRALSVRKFITTDYERYLALVGIASRLAKSDVDRALLVADRMKDERDKTLVKRFALKSLAQKDVERALILAERTMDAKEKAHVLSIVGSVLAKIDKQKALRVFDRALAVAESIEDPSQRTLTFSTIASYMRADENKPTDGFGFGIHQPSPLNGEYALSNLVARLAQMNAQRTLNVARHIRDPQLRARTLTDLAATLWKQR